MRSFQSIFLIIFIAFHLLITFGAFSSIKDLIAKKGRKTFNLLYWCYSLLLVILLFIFYVYPNNPREAHNYTFYFYFNAILFIDIVFKIPINLSYLIALFLKRNNIIRFSGFIIAIGLGLGLVYGLINGNKELKISSFELDYSNLPEEFNDYKIVQISDIHLGSFKNSNNILIKSKEKIQQLKPDIILFTGDLVNNFSYETDAWENVFKDLNSIAPAFSILGNHDYGDYTTWDTDNEKVNNFEEIINAHKKLGFQLLRNENRIICSGNDSIFLLGVENWGHPPFPQYANLEKAFLNIPDESFKILMSHDPAHWESQIANKQNIDLTLSGHTHGLQWGIKLGGIPFSLAYLTRQNWGGLYKTKNNALIVNTGLGTVGIPWRIDMPAEITVITLKSSQVD